MANFDKNLYKWDRSAQSRVYSRSKQITTSNDVSKWLSDTDAGAQAARLDGPPGTTGSGKGKGKAKKKKTHQELEEDRIREAAYAEASDLITQWTVKSVTDRAVVTSPASEAASASDDQHHMYRTTEYKQAMARELELLESSSSSEEDKRRKKKATMPGHGSQLSPEAETKAETHTVMQRLLSKKYVQIDAREASAPTTSKASNLVVKMDTRHQQVKNKRERMLEEKRAKQKQEHERREAEFEARRELKKEEREKALRIRREEEAIQLEMVRVRKAVRKDIEDKQKRFTEEVSQVNELVSMQAQSCSQPELNSARSAAESGRSASRVASDVSVGQVSVMSVGSGLSIDFPPMTDQSRNGMRRSLEKLMEEDIEKFEETERLVTLKHHLRSLEKLFITRKNYKMKQRVFRAWYSLKVESKLQYLQAVAFCEWRQRSKHFYAWRIFVRDVKVTQEADKFKTEIAQQQWKAKVADNFYGKNLLYKCVTRWQMFVAEEQSERTLVNQQQQTRSKMAAFLDAAESGRLWSDRSEESTTVSQGTSNKSKQVKDQDLNSKTMRLYPRNRREEAAQVTNMGQSEQEVRVQDQGGPQGLMNVPSGSGLGATPGPRRPTQAWQVTRQHLELTAEQLAGRGPGSQGRGLAFGKNDSVGHQLGLAPVPGLKGRGQQGTRQDRNISSSTSVQQVESRLFPGAKKKFVPNTFEHRHAAQQHKINHQQKQIQMQQHMIEGLYLDQKHQRLQYQLLHHQINHGIGDKSHLRTKMHDLKDDIVVVKGELADEEDRLEQKCFLPRRKSLDLEPTKQRGALKSYLPIGRRGSLDLGKSDRDHSGKPTAQAWTSGKSLYKPAASAHGSQKQSTSGSPKQSTSGLPKQSTSGSPKQSTSGLPKQSTSGSNSERTSRTTSRTSEAAVRSPTPSRKALPYQEVSLALKASGSRGRQEQPDFIPRGKSPEAVRRDLLQKHPKNEPLAKVLDRNAAERARLRKERTERRQQEKMLSRQEELEARKKQELDEKERRRASLLLYLESKKIEEEVKEEKRRQIEITKARLQWAREKHRHLSMKYRGMKQFKKLLERRRKREENASKFRHHKIMRKVLGFWLVYVAESKQQREEDAKEFRLVRIQKKYFKLWKDKVTDFVSMMSNAVSYSSTALMRQTLFTWRDKTDDNIRQEEKKEQKAIEHYNRTLKKKSVNNWKKLRETEKAQEERRERLKGMRSRVKNLLPDYNPDEDQASSPRQQGGHVENTQRRTESVNTTPRKDTITDKSTSQDTYAIRSNTSWIIGQGGVRVRVKASSPTLSKINSSNLTSVWSGKDDSNSREQLETMWGIPQIPTHCVSGTNTASATSITNTCLASQTQADSTSATTDAIATSAPSKIPRPGKRRTAKEAFAACDHTMGEFVSISENFSVASLADISSLHDWTVQNGITDQSRGQKETPSQKADLDLMNKGQ